MTQHTGWRPTMGANVTAEGTRFALWAPNARRVEVVIEGEGAHELARREDAVHEGTVPGIGAGTRYRFRLGGIVSSLR